MRRITHRQKNLWHLFSIFICALLIVGLITPLDSNTAYALAAPIPIYPLNFSETTSISDPPLGVPSFSWSPVAGANVYRLQVDNDPNFNEPIVINITTRNTSFTPQQTGHLFSDGECWWRVRVEDPNPPGDWSTVWKFTKIWATNDNKPYLLFPADGEQLTFFNWPLDHPTPYFSWNPVMGAAKYRFQIALDDAFATIIYNIDTLTTANQPANRFQNGRYYWRVIPIDIAEHLGKESVTRYFDMVYGKGSMVPELLAPADESFPVFTPTFHWTSIDGAQNYRLEYTSDENCDFAVGTSVLVRQTSFSPTETFPNDFRYCWRVRVESSPAVGDWSDTWHFQKRWYLQPVLLTPTNLYQTALYPLYSWTPVPGAAYYNIQIDDDPSFTQPVESSITANTTYTHQWLYYGSMYYYWRVTPYDGSGKMGLTSNVAEFQSLYDSITPILINPLYYYVPNNYGNYVMNPYEDRTVAYPIFMWHRTMNPAPDGGTFTYAYRIQVDTNPYFEPPLSWEYDTENTIATPTSGNPFAPVPGQDYYWRVCNLDAIDGNCIITLNNAEGWSQIWRARFDSNLALDPTNGEAPPVLLRPNYAQESVEATPLFEWWPVEGATRYEIEISRDEIFSDTVTSELIDIPAYAPDRSIAQRILNRLDFGTFYWRVRAFVDNNWGDWCLPWRFQIASQSEWRETRVLGSADNQLQIGVDLPNDAAAPYDLTKLYASQADGLWYIGFNAPLTTTENMSYLIFIDLDHVDGSGATTPPERGYPVSTIPAHQPEYAIYVDMVNGGISAFHTWVFKWNNINEFWEYGQRFSEISNGAVYAQNGYVELQIPNGAIGMEQVTGSASIILVSVNTGTNTIEDSVPEDPNVPGDAYLSRFTSVTDRLNLISPPSTVSGDPSTIPSLLPFFWDWQTGSSASNPIIGTRMEVHLDAKYTNHVATLESGSNYPHFSPGQGTFTYDLIGDNIYYWRVQAKYNRPNKPPVNSAWASGWSFHRLGFVAQNLNVTLNLSTPTFTWDMAEGASTYWLQVSTDPNFGSYVISQNTALTSFTPQDTLGDGTYYWRVRVNRYGNVGNNQSETKVFEVALPTPDNLRPDGDIVQYAPTFCWDAVTGNKSNNLSQNQVLSAWRYRIQVSQDPTFNSIYDSADTFNLCWTPTMGYHDGTYYWRVAMIDGNGRLGSYSPYVSFAKIYPATALISPVNISVPTTPTFFWTPVDGASTYLFEISQFPTFYPIYEQLETVNTQYTPTWFYTSDRIYYWRVAIRDRYGRLGPYTSARFVLGEVYPVFVPLIQK